ncbi:MAG: hypothetical protein MZV64_49000 [Ignavibacteriales bacterium]|nr:hypothetical protein [Ignavibacteriales bacterium]
MYINHLRNKVDTGFERQADPYRPRRRVRHEGGMSRCASSSASVRTRLHPLVHARSSSRRFCSSASLSYYFTGQTLSENLDLSLRNEVTLGRATSSSRRRAR